MLFIVGGSEKLPTSFAKSLIPQVTDINFLSASKVLIIRDKDGLIPNCINLSSNQLNT